MVENLWLSLGYDFSGFTAKDMSGSDYTQQGVYLRIRWKFTPGPLQGQRPRIQSGARSMRRNMT